ncbi:hypothetical protein IQ264_16075 [Phormidium sp. LEGE 05292]|uniref:hypothetical protein n=1 Tax=[Phormidium] sp. LEGE 05292 TaxID=767427 RepID=UPI00187FAE1D|nr:hypothetical protein [Phormidium sp. LEGE 05292]MBE9226946.1 hypothetical protein [Phormidium sp. LEGE 05292]
MSEQGKSSIGINHDAAAQVAAWLLANYYFDLSGYQPCELVESWLNHYPGNWLRLAVIEALYQGRYKAVSVEQILIIWHRRNQALYHFNYEFETLICSKLPPEITQIFSWGVSNTTTSTASSPEPQPITSDSELEATEKSASISHPFEVFAQSSPPSSATPNLPSIQTQETEPDLPSTADEPAQTSNLDNEYQVMTTQEEYISNTQNSTDDSSDRSPNNYPFPDLFAKLRALALQHQQLINQQQQEM